MRKPKRTPGAFLVVLGSMLGISLWLLPGPATAQENVETLRKKIEEQRAIIRKQSEALDKQQKSIDKLVEELARLSQRLEEMERATATPGVSPQASTAEKRNAAAQKAGSQERDSVGDLNSGTVAAGDFPGSFRIPGTRLVSLALGGFVKTAALVDSSAEAMGSDFLPATLGTQRPDQNGAFSMDSTLTRLFLDARAPVGSGTLRGYVEYDLNAVNNGSLGFKLRHAYGSWQGSSGTLVAGHTWSTMMDLRILPEGLTEPTVSGVIFVRQPVVRWSQILGGGFTLHAAIEDPSSADIFSGEPTVGYTTIPDGVLGVEYGPSANWHLRLNGVLRKITVDLPEGGRGSAAAWGLTLTGHLNTLAGDRLAFSGVYGEGVGRYLLGIQSLSGSAIGPEGDKLITKKSWGGMASYLHRWSAKLRSTATAGYAKSEPLDWQPDETFMSSTYASVNLMWTLRPYLTLGIEYAYGKLWNKDGPGLDNHRLAFGIQIY